MSHLTEWYAEQINGILSCYDRVILQGTLPGLCYAEGMPGYLPTHHIRIFDYVHFANRSRRIPGRRRSVTPTIGNWCSVAACNVSPACTPNLPLQGGSAGSSAISTDKCANNWSV
jgi:hypothetical protein